MTDPDGQGPGGQGPGDAHPAGEPDPRPELDIDMAFAAIVADFDSTPPRDARSWPASEDVDDELDDDRGPADEEDDEPARGPDARPPDDPATGSAAGAPGADRRDPLRRRIVLPDEESRLAEHPATGRGPRDWEPADEGDDGYVPPVPPPLRGGDLVSRIAWGAVLGGPLFLLVAALAWQDLPSVLLLLALTAFIGGFVTLVARMPADRPDDPDDGAVV